MLQGAPYNSLRTYYAQRFDDLIFSPLLELALLSLSLSVICNLCSHLTFKDKAPFDLSN
jgi:hypothetical protein